MKIIPKWRGIPRFMIVGYSFFDSSCLNLNVLSSLRNPAMFILHFTEQLLCCVLVLPCL